MKYSIELGIRKAPLQAVVEAASKFFGLQADEHYSDYMGGDYFRIKGQDEEARIQLNRDCDDIAEEDHPEVDVLVIVDPTTRPDAVQEFFANKFDCMLVRREAYPMK